MTTQDEDEEVDDGQEKKQEEKKAETKLETKKDKKKKKKKNKKGLADFMDDTKEVTAFKKEAGIEEITTTEPEVKEVEAAAEEEEKVAEVVPTVELPPVAVVEEIE